jgi:hypothetical protein
MIKEISPRLILFIGFLLVLAGAVLPFLMLLQIFPASFWLGALSYTTTISGLFLGLIGAASYVQLNRRM